VSRRFPVLVGLTAVLCAGALVLHSSEPPRAPAAESLAPSPVPLEPVLSKPGLKLGITEFNPAFVWSRAARPGIAAPFGQWRDALSRVRPAYFRLVIDWAALQPDAAQDANLDLAQGGCIRATPPCLGWAGVREQLAALASRQREGGWETLVVITGTPAWAARGAGGCERDGVTARSRMPAEHALPAYRKLIADVLAAARQEGAQLNWWSAWNEPNHPYFSSPQRTACTRRSPALVPAAYARLAAELQAALDAAPGQQNRVLGELAGLASPGRRSTSVREFIAGLPSPLVCSAKVVSQHAYVGGVDPVDAVQKAVKAHGCATQPRIWITETGAGFAPADLSAASQSASRREACDQMNAQLARWYADPRVDAAFQYTLREDDRFRTGLVSTDLTVAFPTLGLWQAWGARALPTDGPPVGACATVARESR
jgi:hypothetical protein